MLKFKDLFRRKSKSDGSRLPKFLPILEELESQWQAITVEDIERCAFHLRPVLPTDTKLGVLHSAELRRTWALTVKLRSHFVEANLFAQNRANGEEEVRLYMEQANRFDTMEDVALEIFWAQAKDDISGKAWEAKELGVRSGWMFVSCKPQSPMGGFSIEMLGGLPSGHGGQ